MPSRSTKISILLAVDVVFFFIELIAGYAVGSLALVADSFHMLNDVISLIVALYAIKLSKNDASPIYSYGWHRAEIVAALVNGVFLLALCFSLVLEAIERIFKEPEVSNPRLVVIVGTWGLISNVLGLVLFHEHSHSHEETPSKAKADHRVASSSTLPIPIPANTMTAPEEAFRSRHESDLYGYPAATRASVVQAAQDIASPPPPHKGRSTIDNDGSEPASHVHDHAWRGDGIQDPSAQRPQNVLIDIADDSSTESPSDDIPQDVDVKNSHEQHKAHASGAHGSMNMHALILHIIGDALGNVGVIATGLVIGLTTWPYKHYFDPLISLFITAIIFSSALPLVRSASFILLQAVPSTVSLESIRKDIGKLPGVKSVHELHIWQLSEDKIVASVHVLVNRDPREYMLLAHNIRKVLHDHGVHSTTIQPEYEPPPEEQSNTDHCLIPCPRDDVCKPENACCPPATLSSPPTVSPESSSPLVDV